MDTKSAYKIAQELGVTPQAVYKRLTPELVNRLTLTNHLKKDKKGGYRLDPVAEREVKALFAQVEQGTYCVYMHKVPNGKVYIGITAEAKRPEIRWRYGAGYRANKSFYRDIQSYGWKSIEHHIVANGLTKEQAEAEEGRLIIEYKSDEPEKGYNISTGPKTRYFRYKRKVQLNRSRFTNGQFTNPIEPCQKCPHLEILRNQLATKDKQIADISEALLNAQKIALTAQSLHAGSLIKLAEIQEAQTTRKPGWLARLFKRRK